jgi:hypothetical protein
VEELLETLYELNVYRGSQEVEARIIEGLDHLALMSGGASGPLSELLPEKLWQMCWHYVGPERVPMGRDGLRRVLKCIDSLSTMARFCCSFGRGRRALGAISEHTECLFEIGLWYAQRQIANAVIRGYEEALRRCYSEGKLEWPYGQAAIRRSVHRLQKLVQEHQPEWSYQSRRLEALLTI